MDKVTRTILASEVFIQNGRTHTKIQIEEATKIDDVIEKLRLDFKNSLRVDSTEEFQNITDQFFIFSKWNLYKTVYRFNDIDFYNLLVDTEDAEFYQESVKYLPYNCFFIASPEEDVVGFFVYVELGQDETLVYVVEVNDVDNEFLNTFVTMMWIPEGHTIDEGLRDWYNQMQAKVSEESVQTALSYMKAVVKAIYYLSAQNAVIKEVKIPKNKRPKKKDGKPLNIRQWDVGYRIGNDFRKERSTGESESSRTGSRPRPHVRRAHWHHFWCGPSKSQLELKWLAPIFVNTNEEKNNIVSTEHEVLTNES